MMRPRATLHPRDNALYFFCLQDPAQYSAFTSRLIHSFDNTNSVNMGRALVLKNQSANARDALLERCKEMQVQPLGGEDPLEEGMTTHSSMLAWRIPRTEEPGGLQCMVLQRVRDNWATKHSTAQYSIVYIISHLLYAFILCWTLRLFHVLAIVNAAAAAKSLQ